MELIKAGLAGLVGGVVFLFVLWLGQWLKGAVTGKKLKKAKLPPILFFRKLKIFRNF